MARDPHSHAQSCTDDDVWPLRLDGDGITNSGKSNNNNNSGIEERKKSPLLALTHTDFSLRYAKSNESRLLPSVPVVY